MITFIKKLFKRKPKHDRELYVFKSGFALVACKRCGMESIPWTVDKKQAEDYCKRHPENMQEYILIEHGKVVGACRD